MPKHSNTYTIGFVTVMAVITSLLLSTTATSLKKRQEINMALDVKKNILKSFRVQAEGQDIEKFYADKIEGIVVNYRGEVVPGAADDIDLDDEAKKPNVEDRLFPVYILRKDGNIVAYTIPIIGKGLWSTLYGYLSLESDFDTVRGLTFYKHGETPGLGAEIDADWFQNNFVGKKIHDDAGTFVSVSVAKGKAADYYEEPKLSHYVDGISGATITSNGVTKMLVQWLNYYKPYFGSVKK